MGRADGKRVRCRAPKFNSGSSSWSGLSKGDTVKVKYLPENPAKFLLAENAVPTGSPGDNILAYLFVLGGLLYGNAGVQFGQVWTVPVYCFLVSWLLEKLPVACGDCMYVPPTDADMGDTYWSTVTEGVTVDEEPTGPIPRAKHWTEGKE